MPPYMADGHRELVMQLNRVDRDNLTDAVCGGHGVFRQRMTTAGF